MSQSLPPYKLIDTPEELAAFYEAHRNLDWMGFDTEFVGEKRFMTTLCLIQTISDKGLYLIDSIKLKDDLDPFLKLIEDENIRKLTHAGDNDYRLLYILYGTLPRNVFDTQIAAGFAGYNYPTSFRKLVEGETGQQLKKGYAVTDWEKRPFNAKALKYALDDVIPLPELYEALAKKLEKRGRLHWAMEEFVHLEKEAYYYKDPNHDALNSNIMRSLKKKDRVFLLRLFAWRNAAAERRDHSKEMVLPAKYISHIVRGISSGANALRQNRRIPDKLGKKYGDEFERLYNEEPTPEELEILKNLPSESDTTPEEDVLMELLYHVIKYRCIQEEISINMVVPRQILKSIRSGEETAREAIGDGWRKEMLGAYFTEWLASAKKMDVRLHDDRIELWPH